MTPLLTSRPNAIDAFVFAGLSAAGLQCGDPSVAAVAVALGALAFGVVFVPRWARAVTDLVGVKTRARRHRALGIAACCCGAAGLGATVPAFVRGPDRSHAVVLTTPAVLAHDLVEDVRGSLREASPVFGGSMASHAVELWFRGVKTGLFFVLPHAADSGRAERAEVEVPRDAVDIDGAAYPDAGVVLRYEEVEAMCGAGPFVPTGSAYQFNVTIRAPAGPYIDGKYWVVIRIYRGYDEDRDPQKRASLLSEVTAVIDGPSEASWARDR